MEAKAPAIQRPGAAESQHLPEPLEMALQTIAMCNQYMRPVVAEDEEEFHIITPDLPVQQEKAFNLACRVLGEYFAKHVDRVDSDG